MYYIKIGRGYYAKDKLQAEPFAYNSIEEVTKTLQGLNSQMVDIVVGKAKRKARPRIKITKEVADIIYTLIEQGFSIAKIAKQIGVSKSAIYKKGIKCK